MEYRKRKGGSEEISVIGLGMGGISVCSEEEIEQIIRKAVEKGINFFDLCGDRAFFAPFGRAIAGKRENLYFQMHFGAIHNRKGEYGWSRNYDEIMRTVEWELKTLNTDYMDFGFLHCVDEDEDFDQLVRIGIWEKIKQLKEQGVVRHIGFSSHTPSVAERILDTGLVDLMMFSINPAYDFEKGDAYGIGSASERYRLFQRCEKEGIGISVMKPFHGGKLLSAQKSPFRQALTSYQCLQYALDRPGVLTTLPGVQSLKELDDLLGFAEASDAQKDYSLIASFTPENVSGSCVYCKHCQPCPVGIDIGLVNKYYDLALVGDKMAAGHYEKLTVKADACLACGHCDSRCPFRVPQSERMQKIAKYFQG